MSAVHCQIDGDSGCLTEITEGRSGIVGEIRYVLYLSLTEIAE